MKCEAERVDNASHVASKWLAPFQADLLLGKFSGGKSLLLRVFASALFCLAVIAHKYFCSLILEAKC